MKRANLLLLILMGCGRSEQTPSAGAKEPALHRTWTGSALLDSLTGCYSLTLTGISGYHLPRQLYIVKQSFESIYGSAPDKDFRKSKIPYSIDWTLTYSADSLHILFVGLTHAIRFDVVVWSEGFQGLARETW
jgi:hypothetical protein